MTTRRCAFFAVAAIPLLAVVAPSAVGQSTEPCAITDVACVPRALSLGDAHVRVAQWRNAITQRYVNQDYVGISTLARRAASDTAALTLTHPRAQKLQPILQRAFGDVARAADQVGFDDDVSAFNTLLERVEAMRYVSGNVVPMSLKETAEDQVPVAWRRTAVGLARRSRIDGRFGWVAVEPRRGVLTVQGGQQVARRTWIGWRVLGPLHGEPAACTLPYRVAVELVGKRLAHQGC